MSKYRVFISFMHEDKIKVERLAKILKDNGLEPMWSKNLQPSIPFTNEIMRFIAHSHFFIPFITKASIKRGWVNQEIGYAKALNIPILPICLDLDETQMGMIEGLQIIEWNENDEVLSEQLSNDFFKHYFENLMDPMEIKPLFECGALFGDRTKMIADFSQNIIGMGYTGHVRQKARLSSFQIPDRPTNHKIWVERDGEGVPDESRYRLLRKERQWLEKHVKECGCSLIIDPNVTIKRKGDEVAKIRINLLLDFLREVDHPEVKVAIAEDMKENITLVGDWFGALAVNLSEREKGFRQTIFTRHAPTVQRFINSFDDEINDLLKEQKVSAEESKKHAINQLKEICDKL
ncbi:toll/interleukin-1 receptor domain-containing protein [uncultured Methanobacterium sp.]|uniref:toll/interleukin-1 receptor domain-containing protein n=1 Tax=uncultured Methanobacterium sp. TaxID=176306 RepID=UPI002AA91E7C|nr:toll/interleukin-1 receptor domain-containing protein [uncultured Methanobacterium sp.]